MRIQHKYFEADCEFLGIFLWKLRSLNHLLFSFDLRATREAAMDLNTEPSQSEQIVWDDPTAREERAKLADNLQWLGSPSQHSEPLAPPPPPTAENGAHYRDSMTDSELVEMGETSGAVTHKLQPSW